MLSCSDFNEAAVGCCDSCHDDADEGYGDLIECESPDGKHSARVCCRIHGALTLLPDPQSIWDCAARLHNEMLNTVIR